MAQGRAKVVAVDFQSRRKLEGGVAVPVRRHPRQPVTARQVLGRSPVFVIFWRPPARRSGGEYLGGRWDWGWTMFVWTSDAAVGPVWRDLVEVRGYVPERLTRDGFRTFLRRAHEVGGILLDGELDPGGHTMHADRDQLIGRDEAMTVLRR